MVIPCQYDKISDFGASGLAVVKLNDKYGYIGAKGLVVPCQYDYARDFASNGLAAVELNGKYGYSIRTVDDGEEIEL